MWNPKKGYRFSRTFSMFKIKSKTQFSRYYSLLANSDHASSHLAYVSLRESPVSSGWSQKQGILGEYTSGQTKELASIHWWLYSI